MAFAFWNVKGIRNLRDLDFRNLDLVCVAETWLEKTFTPPEDLSLLGFDAIDVPGCRDHDKGRASGGLLCLFNKKKLNIEALVKNSIFLILKEVSLQIIIVFVYLNFNLEITDMLKLIQDNLDKINVDFSKYKTIWCGDFNARVGEFNQIREPEIFSTSNISALRYSYDKVVNKRGKQLVSFMEEKAFFVLNGRVRGDNPAQFTFVASNPKNGKSTIDLIWVDLEFTDLVMDMYIAHIHTASDHFPVILKIQSSERITPVGPARENRVIKWSKDIGESFGEFIDLNLPDPTPDMTPEDLNGTLASTIYQFAREQCLYKKGTVLAHHKLWLDDETRGLKRILNQKLKVCIEANFLDVECLNGFREAKKAYVKLESIKKKKFFDDKLEAIVMARNPKDFWAALRFFRKNAPANAEIVTLEQWTEFYRLIFPARQELRVEIVETGVYELDREFTYLELQKNLNKCKNNKAPGEDGIPAEFFKNLPTSGKLFLLTMFNKILNSEATPERWSKVLVVMLFKKGNL